MLSLLIVYQSKNIGLIINLQREGEHPNCGPQKGLETASGFSYIPEDFTIEDIDVKLCGWVNLNLPDSFEFILGLVKDMASVLHKNNKKVFVHCHSGNNRTGLLIACYMIYNSDTQSLEEIIAHIQKMRPGSLTKKKYIDYLDVFIKRKR